MRLGIQGEGLGNREGLSAILPFEPSLLLDPLGLGLRKLTEVASLPRAIPHFWEKVTNS